VQRPTEFVREQVSTVRETVATAAAEASQVSGTVGSHVGEFIRSQRSAAQVSLRELARAAGVSNPYLSQVERGLRQPSARILKEIARALRISAETLYVQAGILDAGGDGDGDLVAAIQRDPHLSERQKQVLVDVYRSFRAGGAADRDAAGR
jgi:transcriptional regulator with XRE-family HTH domain